MYAISRVQEKPGIWRWTVSFIRRGKPYYKSFYDIKCGGSGKAHATAIAWRNRQMAKCPPLTTREYRQILRSDNESGAPGVIFLRSNRMRQGFWQARMRIGTKQLTKSFSVRKYGFADAYERAVEARDEMLLMVEDRPVVRHPTAKRFAGRQA